MAFIHCTYDILSVIEYYNTNGITTFHQLYIQVLQKKFEDFQHEISASTERYSAVNTLARKLVAEGHSDTVLIKEKQDAVR